MSVADRFHVLENKGRYDLFAPIKGRPQYLLKVYCYPNHEKSILIDPVEIDAYRGPLEDLCDVHYQQYVADIAKDQ